MTEREESCVQVLEGLDDDAIVDALRFSNQWERLAKLRDKINEKLYRDMERIQRHLPQKPVEHG
jgi:hypothetical protein